MKSSKALLPLRLSWTLLSLGSALPIVLMTLGAAAWNGVNVWLGVYLLGSAVGLVGLLFGFCAAITRKRLFSLITIIGATCIAALSAIFAGSLVLSRTMRVAFFIGRFHLPLLAFYAIAICCCAVEGVLFSRFD